MEVMTMKKETLTDGSKILTHEEALEYIRRAMEFYERRVPGFDGVGEIALNVLTKEYLKYRNWGYMHSASYREFVEIQKEIERDSKGRKKDVPE